jgi:hypothetical protein
MDKSQNNVTKAYFMINNQWTAWEYLIRDKWKTNLRNVILHRLPGIVIVSLPCDNSQQHRSSRSLPSAFLEK